MTERYSCARAARARGEAPHASASTVRRWILVEQPGPWGPDAVHDSKLPAPVAEGLSARAADVGARLLLVRRPHGAVDTTRACFVAHTGAWDWWVERLDVDDPVQLLALDFAPLRVGHGVGGRRLEEALHLVCTNGRHDACCAEYGKPLVAALAPASGRVWECSHIGGDRFAGNLVSFPHGVYFGQVDASVGPDVAARYERGELDLAHYRGRSAYSFTTQAGEFFIRRATGLVGVDELAFQRRTPLGGDVFRVVFADCHSRQHEADVRVSREPDSCWLTCHASAPAHPRRHELCDLRTRD